MTRSKTAKNRKAVPQPQDWTKNELAKGMKLDVKTSPGSLRQMTQSSSTTGAIRDLRIAIGLLFMLNQYPQPPRTCSRMDDPEKKDAIERLLSFSDEERLTGAFCFLASTTKDPRKVAALCLEESVEGASITLRIAANHGDLSRVTVGLRNILAIMRAAELG
jgi:hypothetical protein